MDTPDIDAPTGVRDLAEEQDNAAHEHELATDTDGDGQEPVGEEVDAETPERFTLIVTGVAQLVVKLDADYLAEKLNEWYSEGKSGVMELDEGTYINPMHIITFATAEEAPPNPQQSLIPASAIPPGLRAALGNRG